MIRSAFLALIRLYQLFLSPLKRPCCRFFPTCSAYAYDAVKYYGVRRGALMGLKRLLRCHPFHPGGYDPVIKPSSNISAE